MSNIANKNSTEHFPRFAFFGSSDFSVHILDELKKHGLVPSLIISTPDKPRGRKMIITPTVVSSWAIQNSVSVHTPNTLKTPESVTQIKDLTNQHSIDVYIVASYGKIIPQDILDIPKAHVLNVHPSLLPKYRGASPIHSAILADDLTTGVSIIKLDAEMDHGPLIGPQKTVTFTEWPPYAETEKILAIAGAELLADCLAAHVEQAKTVSEIEQNHERATYTRKIEKEDGLIQLTDIAQLGSLPRETERSIFLKIQAYSVWPSVYFFTATGERIKVTRASWKNDRCIIEAVVPAGKNEISWSEYTKNHPLS